MRRLASIFAVSSLLLLVAAPTVAAAKPVVIDLTPVAFDDPFICAGDPVILVSYTGSFKLTLFYDNAGHLLRDAIEGGGRITVTFSANGRSLTGASPAPFRTTDNADGSVTKLRADGLNTAITIPGQGVVLLDTGSLSWAGGFGGPVLAAAGPHEWFVGGDTSAFCAYFAA
jgi:hypothetical protein